MLLNIKINNIYAELINPIDEKKFKLLENQGKFPRQQWISIDGRTIPKNLITKKIVNVENTPHYKFLEGNEDLYKEYFNKNKWKNYGTKHSYENYKLLINSFTKYLDSKYEKEYIECKKIGNKYVIIDGLHRFSLIKFNNPKLDKITIKLNII